MDGFVKILGYPSHLNTEILMGLISCISILICILVHCNGFMRCSELLSSKFHINKVAGMSGLASDFIQVDGFDVLDLPVYTLSTLNADGSTSNANIITYASAVGLNPDIWALSLYKDTLSHANFIARKWGVLQLLDEDRHQNLLDLLGRTSGNEVNKFVELLEKGVSVATLNVTTPSLDLDSQNHGKPASVEVLRDSCAMMVLHAIKDPIDVGDHDLVLCTPVVYYSKRGIMDARTKPLTTGRLRGLDMI